MTTTAAHREGRAGAYRTVKDLIAGSRLLLLVAAPLGAAGAEAQCTNCVGDANNNGTVTVNELVIAVNNLLNGCDGASGTPTPTSSTPVPTPTATPPQVCAVTPGAWSAPNWSTNAAEALALRAQLGALTGASAMRGAEQGTVVLGGVAQLDELLLAGDPSLGDVMNSGFTATVSIAFQEFVELIDAGVGDPINDSGEWTPGPNGGIYGDSPRGMNAGGIEVRQIVEKGLFAGGALYPYAVRLTEGAITPATVEALAAAWGANETLDPNGTVVHSASYSRQMGFHARMADALTDARAFAADGGCVAQRDAAIRTFFRLWEQSMFARVVFYANRGKTLSDAAVTDNEHVEALHQLGEGIGLAIGFHGLADAESGPLAGATRASQDTQLDDLLTALRVSGDLSTSTTGLLLSDAAGFAAAVTAVEQEVQQIFTLSVDEIASFRSPTPG